VLAAAFALFALRTVVLALVWAMASPDPEAALQGWMTPRYVVRLRDVSPDTMRRALDLPEGARDGLGARTTLAQLAAARGVPLDRFLADLEAALAAARTVP
jgi:hypothetical protein